jgi:Fur family ferric uptake transcriptional regulator
MMGVVIDVAQRLRTLGYRMTPQRQLVWDALRRAEHHLTAEEIHDLVARIVPDFNLASVYRTLRLLADLGLANEVRIGDGRGYWELAHGADVVHLHCRVCGRVDHHEGDEVTHLRDHLSLHHRFSPEDADLVIHGVCSACVDQR